MTYRLTPLEIAAGVPWGSDPQVSPLPKAVPGRTPLQALEEATVAGLRRPPCLVSFSGGRDSSTVLAAATKAARREGLPLPIPATLRFPQAPTTEETEWQEAVVRHLGLEEWTTIEIDDQLDLLGPVATGIMRRHGLLWPPNVHVHVPLLEAASGGSLLTGIDGDMLFGGWRWVRAAGVLARRERPVPRDALRIALAIAPPALRRGIATSRRHSSAFEWVRPAVLQELRRAWAAEAAGEPFRWQAWVDWWQRRRYLRVNLWSYRKVADDLNVRIVHPFLEDGFLAAVAGLGGRSGFGRRTQAMQALFGTILPAEVLARSTKASFDRAFWNRHSRRFVEGWQGEGVDPRLVDPAVLRSVWTSAAPHGMTSTILQSAWLDGNGLAGDHADEPGDRLPE